MMRWHASWTRRSVAGSSWLGSSPTCHFTLYKLHPVRTLYFLTTIGPPSPSCQSFSHAIPACIHYTGHVTTSVRCTPALRCVKTAKYIAEIFHLPIVPLQSSIVIVLVILERSRSRVPTPRSRSTKDRSTWPRCEKSAIFGLCKRRRRSYSGHLTWDHVVSQSQTVRLWMTLKGYFSWQRPPGQ